MNIIYFDLWHLNGALIDAVEHYLFLKKNKVTIKLVLFQNIIGIKPKLVFELIQDRYILDFEYIDDIEVREKSSSVIRDTGATMMMVDWGTFIRVPLVPNLWKNIVLWFDYRDDKILNEYKRIDRFKNVTILKEMPYEYGRDYNFKFAFDLYKEYKNGSRKKIAYLNCISKGSKDSIHQLVEQNEYDQIVITCKEGEFRNIKGVKPFYSHPKNFFELFTDYIYIHDGIYFDPRPRLFHECQFYNKKIHYINDSVIKDGGFYRYQSSQVDAIQNRNLTMSDTLIRFFTHL